MKKVAIYLEEIWPVYMPDADLAFWEDFQPDAVVEVTDEDYTKLFRIKKRLDKALKELSEMYFKYNPKKLNEDF